MAACAVPPVQSLSVAGGAVTLAAPPGYCIDRSTLSDRPEGTMVFLGSCAAMGAATAGPQQPLLLSALLSDPIGPKMPGIKTVEAYLASPAGRARLARDGRAASVRILQRQVRDGVLYLRIRDSSVGDADAFLPESWRAVLPLGDRLAVLAALPVKARPVTGDAPRAALHDFVAALRAANPPAAARSGS